MTELDLKKSNDQIWISSSLKDVESLFLSMNCKKKVRVFKMNRKYDQSGYHEKNRNKSLESWWFELIEL